MSDAGQSNVVADDHLPPPSDLTFREALANLRDAIDRVLHILPEPKE